MYDKLIPWTWAFIASRPKFLVFVHFFFCSPPSFLVVFKLFLLSFSHFLVGQRIRCFCEGNVIIVWRWLFCWFIRISHGFQWYASQKRTIENTWDLFSRSKIPNLSPALRDLRVKWTALSLFGSLNGSEYIELIFMVGLEVADAWNVLL